MATSHRSWRKSSYSSATSACVEVAVSAELVATRDSKHPVPTLTFPRGTFRTFLRRI
jgi:hypothetical protein